MKLFSATVRAGILVPEEGAHLAEGASVTVLAEDEAGFELSSEAEEALADALAEADRGEVVPAAEVFRRLRR